MLGGEHDKADAAGPCSWEALDLKNASAGKSRLFLSRFLSFKIFLQSERLSDSDFHQNRISVLPLWLQNRHVTFYLTFHGYLCPGHIFSSIFARVELQSDPQRNFTPEGHYLRKSSHLAFPRDPSMPRAVLELLSLFAKLPRQALVPSLTRPTLNIRVVNTSVIQSSQLLSCQTCLRRPEIRKRRRRRLLYPQARDNNVSILSIARYRQSTLPLRYLEVSSRP